MYRSNRQQLEFPDFYLPFSGELNRENRWVKLASLVPWGLAEQIYHADLCEDFGAPIVSSRVALGALIIKERLRLTDRETVETIRENPFLQFFIGQAEFSQERPFDASLMVDFRTRFGEEGMQQIADAIALASLGQQTGAPASSGESTSEDSHDDPPSAGSTESDDSTKPIDSQPPAAEEPISNRGRLLSDATCAPADIRYPTDVSLLNEAREKSESLIDKLHQPLVGKEPRPRTYRRKSRKAVLSFIKRKKPSKKKVRAAIRQQLGFLNRNLKFIDKLLANPHALPLQCLSHAWYKHLLVCREVHRQQLEMFESKTQRVADRIVSVTQPHVRPIKRGKAGRDTEFGAKLTMCGR